MGTPKQKPRDYSHLVGAMCFALNVQNEESAKATDETILARVLASEIETLADLLWTVDTSEHPSFASHGGAVAHVALMMRCRAHAVRMLLDDADEEPGGGEVVPLVEVRR